MTDREQTRRDAGKYRTIVADPPWKQSDRREITGATRQNNLWVGQHRTRPPYPSMTNAEIADLPVRNMAAGVATLFLWTTRFQLRAAYDIAAIWGFKPVHPLVWTKPPRPFLGGTFPAATEFIIYAKRGRPAHTGRGPADWFSWPRGPHSTKPEAFLDLVETVSPGPYLELFARRQRLGWDTWGNEALEHVSLA